MEMEKVDESHVISDLKKISCVVNTYFAFMEATELLLRESEYCMNQKNRVMTHELKQRHNQMMTQMRIAKSTVERYMDLYAGAFTNSNGEFQYKKYDGVRQNANYFARIGLLITDRTAKSEGGELETQIEKFISDMPTQGILEDVHLKHLTLK